MARVDRQGLHQKSWPLSSNKCNVMMKQPPINCIGISKVLATIYTVERFCVVGRLLGGPFVEALTVNVNKQKRLEWAQQNVNDNFDNVIWTDECSVQLESHRRFCCHKKIGEAPRPKGPFTNDVTQKQAEFDPPPPSHLFHPPPYEMMSHLTPPPPLPSIVVYMNQFDCINVRTYSVRSRVVPA